MGRADFLRQKESNMRQIVGKAYTELGKELYEAQQRLASHNKYKGVFLQWLAYMEYPQRTAYELIDRYKELLRIPQDMGDTFEALPISLSKTISSPSAESTPEKAQAKTEVLSGDNLINGFVCIYNSRGMYLRNSYEKIRKHRNFSSF